MGLIRLSLWKYLDKFYLICIITDNIYKKSLKIFHGDNLERLLVFGAGNVAAHKTVNHD